MSGGSVPYHLRQNKAIERNLFIELLSMLNRFRPIIDYTYVGFGGPFLEDFKLMHSHFGNVGMISLENDGNVLSRQVFNAPLDCNCIKCIHLNSGDFIDTYAIDGNSIIWLDFADANKIGDQVREFSALITKLRAYDILKITLNANPDCLGNPDGTAAEKRQRRLSNLKSRLAGKIPTEISEDDMDTRKLPGAICKILRNTAKLATKGRGDEIFMPLSSFVYADSDHQMLTHTGVILPVSEKDDFLRTTTLDRWGFSNLEWGNPVRIRVPELTIKERLFINAQLPSKDEVDIHNDMKVFFADDEFESLALLKNYIMFYRHFPYYSRIAV